LADLAQRNNWQTAPLPDPPAPVPDPPAPELEQVFVITRELEMSMQVLDERRAMVDFPQRNCFTFTCYPFIGQTHLEGLNIVFGDDGISWDCDCRISQSKPLRFTVVPLPEGYGCILEPGDADVLIQAFAVQAERYVMMRRVVLTFSEGSDNHAIMMFYGATSLSQ
jgi:hypothetical protein